MCRTGGMTHAGRARGAFRTRAVRRRDTGGTCPGFATSPAAANGAAAAAFRQVTRVVNNLAHGVQIPELGNVEYVPISVSLAV